MSFRYFAYGSNLWPPQMRSRCPSAHVIGTAKLEGWSAVYDKPSEDGSAKLNIRLDPDGSVEGVVYEIDDGERQALDAAEPGYAPIEVDVACGSALTYSFGGDAHDTGPYDWYVATVALGAASHGIAEPSPEKRTVADPIAPGLRPAGRDDVPLVQEILADGLTRDDTGRYYIHPGDFAWWVYHDDPRHPDHFSTWVQEDAGFATIDSLAPYEINVFTRPGVDRWPLIRWAQRRVADHGEVGWVSDRDGELVGQLEESGYAPVFAFRSYEWDLGGDIPGVDLPAGWEIRPVAGEREANARRAAAHAAFESTMPPPMHLQRYLDFMRSPVYAPERDLVAVAPDGTIVAFMVWWADPQSGIAQIEPFGTHPDFQRRGIGRALIHEGLRAMRSAGMTLARVCTDDDRPATAFYEACGFSDVGRLRWWKSETGS